MSLKARIDEAVRELTEIGGNLEEVFGTAHSVRFLFRSAVDGVDYAARAARLVSLEERVQQIGGVFFAEAEPLSSSDLRLARTYWCYILLAASALVEWAEDLDLEFRERSGYDRRSRQMAIRRYVDAIGMSKAVGRKLLARSEVSTL